MYWRAAGLPILYPVTAMKIATRYLVRRMRMDDIPQVLEIERESFPAMWPPTAFKRELQQNRLAHYVVVVERNDALAAAPPAEEPRSGAIGRLFGEIRQMFHTDGEGGLPPLDERPELIVGFVGLWVMPDEAHIVTIATRGTHRHRGIGEMLLIRAIEIAQVRGEAMVTLEVRVSNEAAIALYEKYGFVEVGRRKRYYSDNGEDAYILTVDSVLTPGFRDRFSRLRGVHESRHGMFEDAL
jgi:[ribosomal protein S18]-alanine N-acetyltransferase